MLGSTTFLLLFVLVHLDDVIANERTATPISLTSFIVPSVILWSFAMLPRVCDTAKCLVSWVTGKVPPSTPTKVVGLQSRRMHEYANWPLWLQALVVAPNGLLASAALWLWWPDTSKDWRKVSLVVAYLVSFYLFMQFVFHF